MRSFFIAIFKSGTGQFAAVACAVVSIKILAVIAGPSGVGLYSLLRQIQQTMCAIASFGGQNALIQGVASREGAERERYIASAGFVVAGAVIVSAALMVSLAVPLSGMVLPTEIAGAELIRWSTFPVLAGTILIVSRSLLNAEMRIGAVASVNIAAGIGSVLLAYPAASAYRAGDDMALVAMLGGALAFGAAIALYLALTGRSVRALLRRTRICGTAIKQFTALALPSLLVLFAGMGTLLIVRTAVARWHGLAAAGHFDAAWSVSVSFVVVFLTSLHNYLLPALSNAGTDRDRLILLRRAMRLGMILAVPLLTLLVLLKPLVVHALYSDEFDDALRLLRWILLGDYIRVIGFILATSLFAHADMRAYVAIELVWNLVFIVGALWLADAGIEGAGPAYVAAYLAYTALLAGRMATRYALVFSKKSIGAVMTGGCIVLFASAATWNDTITAWPKFGIVVLAGVFSVLSMTGRERSHVCRLLRRLTLRAR